MSYILRQKIGPYFHCTELVSIKFMGGGSIACICKYNTRLYIIQAILAQRELGKYLYWQSSAKMHGTIPLPNNKSFYFHDPSLQQTRDILQGNAMQERGGSGITLEGKGHTLSLAEKTTQTNADSGELRQAKLKSADLEGRLAFVKKEHSKVLQGLYREIERLQNRNQGEL